MVARNNEYTIVRTQSVRLRNLKRVPYRRPFFSPALLCLLPLLYTSPANANCLSDSHSELVEVARITDGDTVVLTDKRKVRIIGVNTAELHAKHPLSRSLARQGSNAVKQWLANSDAVYLIEGRENEDRHGRALAHLRNEHGELLSEYLVRTGMAAASAVAPNTRCANHLLALEKSAQSQHSGVWQESNPWFVTTNKLSKKKHSGFHIVQARVVSLEKRKRDYVVKLDNSLILRIPTKLYKTLSGTLQPQNNIEVRGWISFRKNKPRMSLYHSTNLRAL